MTRFAAVAVLISALFAAWSPAADAPADAPAAGASGWTTRYDDALKLSKETGRPILACFTASDWVPHCIKQEQEVFAAEGFKRWADGKVVLLMLDFPDRKPQDETTRSRNKQLKAQWNVKDFPTVVFIAGGEREVGRIDGYTPGTGAEKWVAAAERIVAKTPK